MTKYEIEECMETYIPPVTYCKVRGELVWRPLQPIVEELVDFPF